MTSSSAKISGISVLENLGFPDAPELILKAKLYMKLNDVIMEMGLNQVQAAEVTGLTQPRISAIRNYRLADISVDRLMRALVALNQKVEIVITPAKRKGQAAITVSG